MLKDEKKPYITVNPKMKTRFTLYPASHLSEVDFEPYQDGKLIRSSFFDRIIDTYLYFTGFYIRDTLTDEIIGGKAGAVDFAIPHYFAYHAWRWWTQDPIRTWGGILITIPLGILCSVLFIIKTILSIALTIACVPFVGFVHLFYLDTYLDIKESLKKLIIAVEDTNDVDVSHSAESDKDLIEAEPEHDEIINKPLTQFSFEEGFVKAATYHSQTDKKEYPHLIEHVPSFRPFLSNFYSKIQLVEDQKQKLYIKVTKPPETHSSTEAETKTFFIKVDPKNSKPLRQALHLNIFGITSYLENKMNDQGVSDLDRVHDALMPKQKRNSQHKYFTLTEEQKKEKLTYWAEKLDKFKGNSELNDIVTLRHLCLYAGLLRKSSTVGTRAQQLLRDHLPEYINRLHEDITIQPAHYLTLQLIIVHFYIKNDDYTNAASACANILNYPNSHEVPNYHDYEELATKQLRYIDNQDKSQSKMYDRGSNINP